MPGARYQSRMTQFSDDNGDPLSGGTLTFYTTGTSTLEDIYLDEDLNDKAANPLTLDADGRMPTDVFTDNAVTYRVVLKSSSGATIAEDDPYVSSSFASDLAAHNADPASHVTATTTNRGVVSELANDAEAQAKTDTSRVLTPSNLAALGATDTLAGLIEIATDAEVQAGTDTGRAVTPAGLQACTATATRKGVAELATSAEILSSDADRIMSAAAFAANFTGNATSANWKFPGGHKLLVGQFTSNDDGEQTVDFAEAFASYCSIVIVQESNQNSGGAVVSWTTTGFVYNRDDDIEGTPTLYYIALGK